MTITRQIIQSALLFLLALVAGFVLFVGLIRTPMLAGPDAILFYRGVALAVAAAVLLLVGLAVLRRKWMAWTVSDIIAAAALSLSFNLCFLVLIPVTLDRSISVFLLARMQAEGVMTEGQLRDAFVDDYVMGMDQIHRRMIEQSASGNIVRDGDKIRLSPQGEGFLRNARTIGGWFNTDPRFLVGGEAQKRP